MKKLIFTIMTVLTLFQMIPQNIHTRETSAVSIPKAEIVAERHIELETTVASRSLIRRLILPHKSPSKKIKVKNKLHQKRKSEGCTQGNWRTHLTDSEIWIIKHEAGIKHLRDASDYFLTHDPNPSSSAFGIWQGLYSTRVEYASKFGYDPDTVNPCQQLRMMRRYIKDRYGDTWSAVVYWEANKSY